MAQSPWGNDDDVLVAGVLAWSEDENFDLETLSLIRAEWRSNRSYSARTNNLRGVTSGGLNGTVVLQAGVNVVSDAAKDSLYGNSGSDWILCNRTTDGGPVDVFFDSAGGELFADTAKKPGL